VIYRWQRKKHLLAEQRACEGDGSRGKLAAKARHEEELVDEARTGKRFPLELPMSDSP